MNGLIKQIRSFYHIHPINSSSSRQLIMCHNLPRIGYKIPYNKNVTNIIPQMIKVGTNVKSKIHDDLTGHVVICEPINNYAVIMTDIIDYEMMTVECFLSDLEVA